MIFEGFLFVFERFSRWDKGKQKSKKSDYHQVFSQHRGFSIQ